MTEPPRCIAIVMKRPGNRRVMTQALARADLASVGAGNEQELATVLATPPRPALALVDVSGFADAAWRMCAALQESRIPFVVLSAPQELEVSSRSVEYGAASILQKPIAKSALLQLVLSLVR